MSAAQENTVTDPNREAERAGEVQEDARAALQAAVPYLETLHSIVGGEARASVWRCIERGRAALAARQPGAQMPVDDDWHLRGYAYASKQATTCAGCGKHKHTPLRIDAMGGHVCLTCIDQKLGVLLGEFGYPPAQGIDLGPRPMDTAPRDGTLVRLLVDFDENAIDDSIGATWTIGACNDENVSEGARIGWQFVGWCWTHDHFTESTGTPVGWLPLIDGQRDAAQGVSQ